MMASPRPAAPRVRARARKRATSGAPCERRSRSCSGPAAAPPPPPAPPPCASPAPPSLGHVAMTRTSVRTPTSRSPPRGGRPVHPHHHRVAVDLRAEPPPRSSPRSSRPPHSSRAIPPAARCAAVPRAARCFRAALSPPNDPTSQPHVPWSSPGPPCQSQPPVSVAHRLCLRAVSIARIVSASGDFSEPGRLGRGWNASPLGEPSSVLDSRTGARGLSAAVNQAQSSPGADPPASDQHSGKDSSTVGASTLM